MSSNPLRLPLLLFMIDAIIIFIFFPPEQFLFIGYNILVKKSNKFWVYAIIFLFKKSKKFNCCITVFKKTKAQYKYDFREKFERYKTKKRRIKVDKSSIKDYILNIRIKNNFKILNNDKIFWFNIKNIFSIHF